MSHLEPLLLLLPVWWWLDAWWVVNRWRCCSWSFDVKEEVAVAAAVAAVSVVVR